MPDQAVKEAKATLGKHGLAVMLLGLVGGFAWAFALLGEVRISPVPLTFFEGFPGHPDRWRAVHTGCILNGLMALAIAALLDAFHPTQRQLRFATNGVLLAIWGNAGFYICSVFAPNRSLSMGDNALGAGNLFGAVGYSMAMIAAFGLIAAIVVLLRTRGADPERR